jgi:acylphosphatase
MAERAVHVGITGRVQGVGFRDWLAGEARTHGLSGWVRNRRDGSVEAVFAGDEAALEAVTRACREGPPMAAVENVATKEAAEVPGPGFQVLPTA